MARNAEKAMTALARWRAAQMAEQGKGKERRPYLASECDDLKDAEKWRSQIIREISKKVSQIQNAGLGEFKLRDLNDEINKLLREKGHWEVRIRELGGPDYHRVGPRIFDKEGKEVPGNRGYKYFGAAKDLPGVRDLFEQPPAEAPRKTRAELVKDVDADYYGYRDEDDGVLVPLEKAAEKDAVRRLVAEWKGKKEAGMRDSENQGDDIQAPVASQEQAMECDEVEEPEVNTKEDDTKFFAHVPVPSQEDIEKALVERRKRELLLRYAGGAD